MTVSRTTGSTTAAGWKKAWIVLRFVVFGVGGFWLLMLCWVALVEGLTPHGEHIINPFLALPLAAIGALMMLFGGGVWGRWGYLWVFLSTPITISLIILLAPFFPDIPQSWEILDPKLLGIAGFTLPMVVSYALVRRYYQRRDERAQDTTPT